MNRFKTDAALTEAYTVKDEDDDTVTFSCKAKDEVGEACTRVYNCDTNADGTIDRGVRNALLAHWKAHQGGHSKMRRVS